MPRSDSPVTPAVKVHKHKERKTPPTSRVVSKHSSPKSARKYNTQFVAASTDKAQSQKNAVQVSGGNVLDSSIILLHCAAISSVHFFTRRRPTEGAMGNSAMPRWHRNLRRPNLLVGRVAPHTTAQYHHHCKPSLLQLLVALCPPPVVSLVCQLSSHLLSLCQHQPSSRKMSLCACIAVWKLTALLGFSSSYCILYFQFSSFEFYARHKLFCVKWPSFQMTTSYNLMSSCIYLMSQFALVFVTLIGVFVFVSWYQRHWRNCCAHDIGLLLVASKIH